MIVILGHFVGFVMLQLISMKSELCATKVPNWNQRHYFTPGRRLVFKSLQYEPPHDKTNEMASAQSDQSLRCPHEESLGP